MVLVLGAVLILMQGPQRSTIPYSFFVKQVSEKNVLLVELGDLNATGVFETPPDSPPVYDSEGNKIKAEDEDGRPKKLRKHFRVEISPSDQARSELQAMLLANNVVVEYRSSGDSVMMTIWLIAIFLPLGLLLFFWISYRRSRDQFMGGGFLSSFSKSPAKRYEPSGQTTSFD
ncbi:MAG: hypothetical protein ACTSRN_08465, partial [Alphaproteobacteria bacterium]